MIWYIINWLLFVTDRRRGSTHISPRLLQILIPSLCGRVSPFTLIFFLSIAYEKKSSGSFSLNSVLYANIVLSPTYSSRTVGCLWKKNNSCRISFLFKFSRPILYLYLSANFWGVGTSFKLSLRNFRVYLSYSVSFIEFLDLRMKEKNVASPASGFSFFVFSSSF